MTSNRITSDAATDKASAGGPPAHNAALKSLTGTEEILFQLIGEELSLGSAFGVWATNAQGQLLYLSPSFQALLGLTPDECRKTTWRERLDESERESLYADWHKNVQRKSPLWSREFRIRAADQTLNTLLSRGAPVLDSEKNVLGWAGILLNLTEQRRAEQERREAEERQRAADKSSLAKSHFLANMSHEIRTPLGAVLGFTELLLNGAQTPTEQSGCVNAIQRNGQILLNLINDILDLSKVESGHLDLEQAPISLDELVAELKHLFAPQAEAKELHFEVESSAELPPLIHTDPTRVRQIIFNLVGNALKFTSHGRISVHFLKRGDHLLIRVRDTGPGISNAEASAEHLFHPFSRLSSTTGKRQNGNGLGLALSRQLARALGGDLRLLASDSEHGSVFEAELPLESRPSPESRERSSLATMWLKPSDFQGPFNSSSDANSSSNSNSSLPEIPHSNAHFDNVEILLVDDSPDIRELIRRIFSKLGAHVTMAEHGRDGLEKALSGRFDVILMDIQMPVMDGCEATRRLRQIGYRGPIIALTAHAMKEEKEQIIAAGCNAHLAKPIDRLSLIANIQKCLRQDLELRLP
jgi:PAS domain S-box-containing protein